VTNLDVDERKIHVIFLAVPSRIGFVKKHNDTIKLLFVASGRNPSAGDFYAKGGNEIIEAFVQLEKTYHDRIQLVVRGFVPESVKLKVSKCPNLRILDKVIPRKTLVHEYETADILLHPSHQDQNVVVIEGMSFELPVIALDVYNYSEWIDDGRTGFLIRPPDDVPYYWKDHVPSGPSPMRSAYDRAVRTLHPIVVRDLVDRITILMEDNSLLERMGRRARMEVETGKFCLDSRNRKLKTVLDSIFD
jgi:glycosyltransferase involved in cell wall biosynthesis